MIILNDGDSFSAYHNEEGRTEHWISYCKYFEGKVFNLARKGSCITVERVKDFLIGYTLDKEQKDEITHFIFQVPTPTRQIFHSALIKTDCYLDIPMSKGEFFKSISLYLGVKHQTIPSKKKEEIDKEKDELLKNFRLEHKLVNQAVNFERYYQKAIEEVDKSVSLIRRIYPNIKIILIRYEHTGKEFKLIETFSKEFFKKTLSDYAQKNNVTYVYESNFCSSWFRGNGLANDTCHPNEEGAKLIANKIKEFL